MRPFTPAQIKLLETFADQAVIAIENVRLLRKSSTRLWSSRRRRVRSWVSLRAHRRISQPVLDVVAENAARLCEADGRFDLSHRWGHSAAGGGIWVDAGTGRYRDRPSPVAVRSAELWSTGKRFTSMTSPQRCETEFPECQNKTSS